MDRRWYFVVLVVVAIAISYFDRQTLPVAIHAMQHSIPLSEQQFSYLQTAFLLTYASLYVIGGRMLDRVGTRRGFVLIMVWWSLACMLHGAANGFWLLLTARLLLGAGEGGAFPAATRVVAEWMAPAERSTAMGFINGGTAVGSLLAPPMIGWLLLHSGWRAVFVAAGLCGLAWVAWWLVAYDTGSPTVTRNTLDARLLALRIPWMVLLRQRKVQSLVFAKFMSDAAWYFLLFWLPKYLYDARGFDVKQVSAYGWIPYAASGLGSVVGGWSSSRLLRGGASLDVARKVTLGCCAALMPVVMLVSVTPVRAAIGLFSIAFFAQQAWSGLMMTLPADIFPLTVVGSVAGMIGFGGAMGGALFSLVAGALLGHGISYGFIFCMAGTFHLIGFAVVALYGGRIQPLDGIELRTMEGRA
ncbi:MAG: MFS transporter [Acidobacteriota bacterium]|nr:MFS transporter [Acidobacteriota bacterium]